MAAPPTADLTDLLPWAWSLEHLSDNPSAPLPLLYGWFKKVPENSGGQSFKNARERFALRCLQDVLDSGFDGEADEGLPDGGTRVDVDLNGSAEDVIRKLAWIKAEGKSMRTSKHDLEQFIQQRRANLSEPFLRRASKFAHFGIKLQSLENKFNNVRHEEACSPDCNHTPERTGNKDGSINVSPTNFSKKSYAPSENMDVNLPSRENVQCHRSKFVSEINKFNFDTCTLEKTPAKQFSGIGDAVPPLAHADDYMANTIQNLEQENGIGKREILSRPSDSNNDGGGDLKSNAAQKVIDDSLTPSENTEENLASGEDVQYHRNKFVSKINKNNSDSCTLERTPVNKPSGSGDVMPPMAHTGGYFASIGQNPDQENGLGNWQILSRPSSCNNVGLGDLKSKDAEKELVEKLQDLLRSQGNPNTMSESGEQALCIRCGDGGVLLTCCNSGCPVAVHGHCLGSFKELEDSGKFYCPFCSYWKAHAAYLKAKEKVQVAKRELSAFLNGNLVKVGDLGDFIRSSVPESNNPVKESMVDHHCIKSTSEQLDKQADGSLDCHKGTEVRASGTEVGCSPDAHNHDIQLNDIGGTVEMNDKKHLKASAEAKISLGDVVMVSSPSRNGAEMLEEDSKGLNTSNVESGKDAEHVMDDIMYDDVGNNPKLKGRAQKRRKNVVQPFVQEKLTKLQIHKKGLCRKSPRDLTPKKSYVSPNINVGRRVQLRWTAEEEAVLKELVSKFLSNGGGIIPWRTMLEDGKVFHRSRTPMDLKDKWKNILKYQDRTRA